jgi:hypothetical protein
MRCAWSILDAGYTPKLVRIAARRLTLSVPVQLAGNTPQNRNPPFSQFAVVTAEPCH